MFESDTRSEIVSSLGGCDVEVGTTLKICAGARGYPVVESLSIRWEDHSTLPFPRPNRRASVSLRTAADHLRTGLVVSTSLLIISRTLTLFPKCFSSLNYFT